MPVISPDQLRTLTEEIFIRKGATRENAETVARLLVRSNLAGHDSHGVIRVASYARSIDQGRLDPRAKGVLEIDGDAVGLVNGYSGFGQVVATQAMNIAISKGKRYGVSVVTTYNCGHVGRLADYSMMALQEGMIGITTVNSEPAVAPFGGVERMFNPSPIGAAVPASRERPFVLDISMGVCAVGKIMVKRARGERLPPGWIIDRDGNPSVDPSDYFDGGSVLPIGGDVGYKGYGLAFLVDILSGVLSGNGAASSREFRGGNGVFMLAIDISRFVPINVFKERIDELIGTVKASRKAPGVKEILVPGEPEFIAEEAGQRNGIFVEESTWIEISGLAKELGVSVPRPLRD